MLRRLRCFQTEWRAEILLPAQDRSGRGDWNSELTRDHFRLSPLAGTRRAQKHKSPFHLATIKEGRDTADDEHGDADIKPHECGLRRCFTAIVGRAVEATPDASLAQETVVMSLNQMRFYLAHRVQHHANNNEQTRAAEKLRGYLRNVE